MHIRYSEPQYKIPWETTKEFVELHSVAQSDPKHVNIRTIGIDDITKAKMHKQISC